MEPITYKYIPPDPNHKGRYLHLAWVGGGVAEHVIQDEPGFGGCYPCYSLVEDTEVD